MRVLGNYEGYALPGRVRLPSTICSVFAVLIFGDIAHADEFMGIGWPNQSYYSSIATAVSGNGNVIIGYSTSSPNYDAFRWSSGVFNDLGYAPGYDSIATSVNFDGSVIAGFGLNNELEHQAVRWTSASGLVGLDFLDQNSRHSEALGVSADGTTIVGRSLNSSNSYEAVQWVGTGVQGLGFLGVSSNPESKAMGVNADGSVIVGSSTNASGKMEAFRWTASSGMTGLGFLNASDSHSVANAVNYDGKVIVGDNYYAEYSSAQAFRWTAETGMTGSGFLDPNAPYPMSIARAVNADGSVIVGTSRNPIGFDEAYRWTRQAGMQSISSLLSSAGIHIGSWVLVGATGVSADGRVIVGVGFDPDLHIQAWFVRLSPITGFISASELTHTMNDTSLKVLQSQQVSLSALADTRFVALEQCRSDSGRTTKAGLCVFITGAPSFWSDNDALGKGRMASGIAGVAMQIAPGAMLGAGINASKGSYDLRLDGSNDIDAFGGSAFITYTPNGYLGLQALIIGTAGNFSQKIDRNYVNGAFTAVTSCGSTNGQSAGALAHLGWGFRLFDQTILKPFAEMQWSSAINDAYTEAGGTFPMAFDRQTIDTTDMRLGAHVRYQATKVVDVFISAAWAHRVSGNVDALAGQVIDLFETSSAVPVLKRDWVEATSGVNWMVAPNTHVIGALSGAFGNSDQPSGSARVGFSQTL